MQAASKGLKDSILQYCIANTPDEGNPAAEKDVKIACESAVKDLKSYYDEEGWEMPAIHPSKIVEMARSAIRSRHPASNASARRPRSRF